MTTGETFLVVALSDALIASSDSWESGRQL